MRAIEKEGLQHNAFGYHTQRSFFKSFHFVTTLFCVLPNPFKTEFPAWCDV